MQKFSSRAKMRSMFWWEIKVHRARAMESAIFLVTFTVYCCRIELQTSSANA